jgi:hypothetical protein
MLSGVPPFHSYSKVELNHNVIHEPVAMKPHFSPAACDLLSSLLERQVSHRQPHKRLSDTAEVRRHAFFQDLDWTLLAAKELSPPIKPVIRHSKDLRYFERISTGGHALDLSLGLSSSSQNKVDGFSYETHSIP